METPGAEAGIAAPILVETGPAFAEQARSVDGDARRSLFPWDRLGTSLALPSFAKDWNCRERAIYFVTFNF